MDGSGSGWIELSGRNPIQRGGHDKSLDHQDSKDELPKRPCRTQPVHKVVKCFAVGEGVDEKGPEKRGQVSTRKPGGNGEPHHDRRDVERQAQGLHERCAPRIHLRVNQHRRVSPPGCGTEPGLRPPHCSPTARSGRSPKADLRRTLVPTLSSTRSIDCLNKRRFVPCLHARLLPLDRDVADEAHLVASITCHVADGHATVVIVDYKLLVFPTAASLTFRFALQSSICDDANDIEPTTASGERDQTPPSLASGMRTYDNELRSTLQPLAGVVLYAIRRIGRWRRRRCGAGRFRRDLRLLRQCRACPLPAASNDKGADQASA